jgi:hypothetical protein
MSETPGGPRAGTGVRPPRAWASSTATRRSISPRTWSSFSSPEPSLKSAATDFRRNSIAWSRSRRSRPSLSLSSASSARLPCLIARRRRPTGSSTPPLQGDQGINAAERSQRDRRAVRRVGFGNGEAATSAAPPADAGSERQRAHSVRRCACVHVAPSWSMGGKMPPRTGKNCRNRRQNLPSARAPRADAARRPGAL